jgi:hypothetical protein
MISMIPSGLVLANCPTQGVAVINGLTNHFTNCGPAPTSFIWYHGRGIQGVIGAENAANQGNTPSGHDSANRSGIADGTFSDFGAPGEWYGGGDFGNQGWDGCIQNFQEGTSTCNGGPDFPPLDYVLAGVDPAQPNIARMAAVSVDWNEVLTGWVLDNAGAPNMAGTFCDEDALSGNPAMLSCNPIPFPAITGSGPATGGVNINLGIGSTAGILVLDDCAIAETASVNCPRNLYAGRVVVYRHGGCTAAQSAGLSRTSYVYPASPATGTLAVTDRWIVYSVEDGNLNGILEAGEDGTNGGTVNAVLDPFIVAGTNSVTSSIRVPTVPGASDCIFLGLAIGLDNNKLSVNPPTNTIFGELVLSPMVSVNPNPIRSGTGTPVADLVTTIRASKSQGKGTVDWETGVEMTTAGFNVIGTKKNGGETKLNTSLIAAKEGTTGKGATYTVTFDAGQLKGSSAVFVEIVKTDGSKERFGPASF